MELILDASTKYIDMFNVDSNVEELIQVVTTAWTDLIPAGAILSLSYNGGCGSSPVSSLVNVVVALSCLYV